MMTKSDPSELLPILPRNRVARHILFWIWVYALDVIIFGVGYENVRRFVWMALLELPGQVLFAYVIMYGILPRYLTRRNATEALTLVTAAFFAAGILTHLMFLITSFNATDTLLDLPKILLRGFYCALKGGIAIMIKLALLWLENEKRVSGMEKTRLESELKMLKDQVNPHFLFNTLNNLYGLVNQNQKQAQESILRLSAILQFMLHESNHPTIPVNLEIKCIKDYIELEKLRYAKALSVSLNVQSEVKDLSIVPLTLFPFVENSFKHGASELIGEAWINIDFSVYKKDFVFKIANSKHSAHLKTQSGGIGLANVKRRLELVYGKKHSLQIIDDTEGFLVILKIAIDSMNPNSMAKYESELSYS
jgi:two-component system, LytTR family, sensor kinase